MSSIPGDPGTPKQEEKQVKDVGFKVADPHDEDESKEKLEAPVVVDAKSLAAKKETADDATGRLNERLKYISDIQVKLITATGTSRTSLLEELTGAKRRAELVYLEVVNAHKALSEEIAAISAMGRPIGSIQDKKAAAATLEAATLFIEKGKEIIDKANATTQAAVAPSASPGSAASLAARPGPIPTVTPVPAGKSPEPTLEMKFALDDENAERTLEAAEEILEAARELQEKAIQELKTARDAWMKADEADAPNASDLHDELLEAQEVSREAEEWLAAAIAEKEALTEALAADAVLGGDEQEDEQEDALVSTPEEREAVRLIKQAREDKKKEKELVAKKERANSLHSEAILRRNALLKEFTKVLKKNPSSLDPRKPRADEPPVVAEARLKFERAEKEVEARAAFLKVANEAAAEAKAKADKSVASAEQAAGLAGLASPNFDEPPVLKTQSGTLGKIRDFFTDGKKGSTNITLAGQESLATAETNDSIEKIHESFLKARDSHNKAYEIPNPAFPDGQKVSYDVSAPKNDAFIVSDKKTKQELVTVERNNQGVSYKFAAGQVDFNLADVALRSLKKGAVLTLDSHNLADIKSILEAAKAPPNDVKINLSEDTKKFLATQGPLPPVIQEKLEGKPKPTASRPSINPAAVARPSGSRPPVPPSSGDEDEPEPPKSGLRQPSARRRNP